MLLFRVVNHQPAIHELIDRAAACLGYAMKSRDQTAQEDHLRLPRCWFILALETNQPHRVQVDREERVIDRSGQIALIPPFRAKQFVQPDQQANVEDIETYISTDCHRLHQHPLRGSSVALSQRSLPYDIYIALTCASTRGCGKDVSPCFRMVAESAGEDLSSLLLPRSEDLLQRSFAIQAGVWQQRALVGTVRFCDEQRRLRGPDSVKKNPFFRA